MAETERDIDLVLVTGAGASCSFGVNNTRLPLMGDWSNDLVQRLSEKGIGYLQATGLTREMEAQGFEEQLGRFLRSVQAFARIKPLLDPITQFGGSLTPFLPSDQWEGWHQNASFHLAQIVGAVHESLYGLFGSPAIDPGAAHQAYGALFAALGVGPSSRFVYATTNYDTIGEDTIAALGAIPDVGDVQTSPFNPEREIRAERLLEGMPRYVPVLHLHGRVGWLRRQDGGAYSNPAAKSYDAGYGVPIVMLPDLEKDYATDPIISTLWDQFAESLSRARRVFVLGHSFHDDALIRALVDNVTPQSRLAVTVLGSPDTPGEPATDEAVSVRDRVLERLPGAAIIPMQFGTTPDLIPSDIRDWAEDS